MTAVDDVLARSAAGRSRPASLEGLESAIPSLHLAVVTCMDARLDVLDLLGLAPGEAHVMRNAGAAVTPDVLRSLAVSQRVLGTREVLVLAHTRCGMREVDDEELRASIAADADGELPWGPERFVAEDVDVSKAVRLVRESAYLPYRDHVRGGVVDVLTGDVREVVVA